MFAAGLMLTGLIVACQSIQLQQPVAVGPGDWTAEGGSCEHAHYTDHRIGTSLVEAWDYGPRGAFGFGSPLSAGDQLVVSTLAGEVHILDLETGDVSGREEVGGAVEGAPVITEDRLFVPLVEENAGITAFDLLEGGRAWRWREAAVVSPLCFRDSLLYAADVRGRVTALSAEDGAVRWQHEPDSSVAYLGGPVLTKDRLVAVDDRGRVTAFDPISGTVRWQIDLDRPVTRTPAVRGDTVYVSTAEGLLAALDVEDGETFWRYQGPGVALRFTAPSVDAHRVVVGGSDGRVRALDARTGHPLWNVQLGGPVGGAPLLTPDHVITGAADGRLYMLDPRDGARRWSQSVGGRVGSTPLVRNGMLIVLVESADVVAFRDTSRAGLAHRDARLDRSDPGGGLAVRDGQSRPRPDRRGR